MTFTIDNIYNTNIETLKAQVLLMAKKTILLFPMRATEVALEQSLINKYKKTLKQLCIYLLLNCKINNDNDKSIIITFPKINDDILASFITYGNLELAGSPILQIAFQQR